MLSASASIWDRGAHSQRQSRPRQALPITDSAILDQVDDLLANEFGEDERPEIMPDACYELLRHIADDLLDTRKHPEAIPEACACNSKHQQHGTVCRAAGTTR